MSDQLELTKTRLIEGVWEGVLTGTEGTDAPALAVTHQNTAVETITVTPRDGGSSWLVRIAIPVAMIADGVQTFVITGMASGRVLASFALLAGEGLAEDIRSEMNLLRAELDLLKRAFRRHCVETL